MAGIFVTTWLRALFGYQVLTQGGIPVPQRVVLELPEGSLTDDPSNQRTIFQLAGSAAAGNGITYSGGQYSVKADPEGSIVVTSSGVRVGVLANDSEHGTRGGGALHSLADAGTDGFLSSTFWTRLNAATSSAVASTLALRGSNAEAFFGFVGPSGTLPSTGFLRMPSTSTAVAFRNSANSADLSGLAIDGSDNVLIGDATNGTGVYIYGTAAQIPSTTALADPGISGAILSVAPPSGTGSRNGDTWQILGQRGQSQTGTNDNTSGGDLYVQAGAPGTGGSGAAGNQGSLYLRGLGVQVGASGTSVGFFGVSPIPQPSAHGDFTQTSAGSGSPVLADSTTDGGVGGTAYTVSDIVKALKALGLLAQ